MHTFASERTCVRASVVCVCAESETLAPKQGKTTLLYKFKIGEAVATIPTIGFNTEEVQYKNIRFSMWDVGGQERIRALWKHYYQGAHACISWWTPQTTNASTRPETSCTLCWAMTSCATCLSSCWQTNKIYQQPLQYQRWPKRWSSRASRTRAAGASREPMPLLARAYTKVCTITRAAPCPHHYIHSALPSAARSGAPGAGEPAGSERRNEKRSAGSERRNEQRSGARARDLFSVVAAF